MPRDIMTFEPTPALEEDKENFSPLNEMDNMKSPPAGYHETRRGSRGVRFFDPPSTDEPVRRAQSIATTTVPLLQSVSSASPMPRQGQRMKPAAPEVDISAYFEHSRSLLETLRLNHERDKRAFDEERKLWNTERSVLKARIADLEFQLNKSTNGKRRYSNDSNTLNAQSIRADFGSFSGFSNARANTASIARTVSLPSKNPTTNGDTPVWEGPKSTTPVTRVFSTESDQGNQPPNHLTSISETEASTFPELTQEISPTSHPTNARSESFSIDKIDGITLRSTALAPSFVARALTPTQTGSPARSPSPHAALPRQHSQSPPSASSNGNNHLSLSINSLLSPLDEKLKLHAGHTPMSLDGPAPFASSTTPSTEVPTPREEKPAAPAPSARPPWRPREDSDTYFSFSNNVQEQDEVPMYESDAPVTGQNDGESGWRPEADLDLNTEDQDPELKGPLMLDSKNKSNSSNEFLDKLDAKLMEAASASRKDSVLSSSDRGESPPKHVQNAEPKKEEGLGSIQAEKEEGLDSIQAEKDFEMPNLRMKKSTNFGSAYGQKKPGNQW